MSGLAAACVASLIAVGLGFAEPAAAAGPCTDVQVVGLRASGETVNDSEHGMGAVAGSIADAIASQAQGAAGVGFYGLPYPAGETPVTTALTRSYFLGVQSGRQML